MLRKILTSSRYIVTVPVIGCFLAALLCMITGGFQTGILVLHALQMGLIDVESKELVASLFEQIDLFLIGVVFYMIALGLYELFVDDRLTMPDWLVIHNMDDLKSLLISGMVVVMLVYFLGNLLKGVKTIELIYISVPITLIILAMTYFQKQHQNNSH